MDQKMFNSLGAIDFFSIKYYIFISLVQKVVSFIWLYINSYFKWESGCKFT